MQVRPLFIGKVSNLRILPRDKDKFFDYLRKLDGQEIEFAIGRRRKHRSNSQNDYYWGVVVALLSQELGYFPDEVHEGLKFKFLKRKGDVIETARSTTELSTREFEEYLEGIRTWAASELNTVIPEPNEVV